MAVTTRGHPRTLRLRPRSLRARMESLLAEAGVTINGDHPWDIQVHDDRLHARVLAHGSLGLGEAYMDGWWDSPSVDQFIYRVLRADMARRVRGLEDLLDYFRAKFINLQNPSRAFAVGERHYDLGNRLYQHMLDQRMIYSCGYWKDAATLDEAQEAKLDLVFRKLDLRPGMTVLDIGCGWGGAAKFAAERHDVRVVGVTVSREQAAYAEDSCKGLPVEIRLQDFRSVTGTFDRIVSIGMFEHVGPKNYREFMTIARTCLKPNGLFLLHTIGSHRATIKTDPWIARYIFPNSKIPSAREITAAIGERFVLEDWQNFGPDYDTTLLAWRRNFEAAWDELREHYGERFRRMWRYYLLACAASFRARKNQLWQLVLSPRGLPRRYDAPR